MGYFDPVIGVVLALLASAAVVYGLHLKRQIEKLDRIIREKEADLKESGRTVIAPH